MEDASITIKQKVAPVGVGLHEAPLEQLLQRQLQQQRAHRITHLLRHLRHLHVRAWPDWVTLKALADILAAAGPPQAFLAATTA